MAIATAYNVSNLYVEIDGKAGGFLRSFTPPAYEVEQIQQALGPGGETKKMSGAPKIGEAAATFPIAQGGPLFDWVASALRKNGVEANVAVALADHNFHVRKRVDFLGCVLTSVAFPALDAKEAKKNFEIAVTFQPEKVQFSKGDGKLNALVGAKAKNWLTSNFRVKIPGVDATQVTRVELPKLAAKISQERTGMTRLPTRHYTAYEFAGLATEHAPRDFDAVQALAFKVFQDGAITDEEYLNLTVEMYDPTMKNVLGTFTAKYCAPKKFTWSADASAGPLASRIEYLIEELEFQRK